MKKIAVSIAAAGALLATPLFAQEVPRANQPDPPIRASEGAADRNDGPSATQPAQPRTAPGAAAQPRQPAQRGQEGAAAQRPQVQDTQQTDFQQHVAACLILANQAEIAMTEPAIEKLQNEQARELAQMIVKDHTQYISKLKQHAPQAANLQLNVEGASGARANAEGSTARASQDAEGANSTTNAAHADATAAQRSGSESIADQALRAEKAFYEKKVQMMSQQLNKEQGQNFDQAFLGAQVAEHVTMVAKLQALQSELQGDQEFVALLKEGEQSASKHLQEAIQLMQQEKDVEGNQAEPRAGARTDERSEGAAPRTDRPAATAPQR